MLKSKASKWSLKLQSRLKVVPKISILSSMPSIHFKTNYFISHEKHNFGVTSALREEEEQAAIAAMVKYSREPVNPTKCMNNFGFIESSDPISLCAIY
ncbi:hypothetical protein Ahy_A03g015020 isoform J [Arachis hypogaea]|uniref:Uncharacterized protein n=1 Tax=Arachis hypogaea TaxID=3818 RepID=A0A445DZG3_ARAHY|nr:hypothetical protein Ahy_A03g015020 isoform J [Arachis hypogaea]